jgi:hypothetical protein
MLPKINIREPASITGGNEETIKSVPSPLLCSTYFLMNRSEKTKKRESP